MRREKLLQVGGNSRYERPDPTSKSVNLVAIENTYSLNCKIEKQLLRGVRGDYLRYAT